MLLAKLISEHEMNAQFDLVRNVLFGIVVSDVNFISSWFWMEANDRQIHDAKLLKRYFSDRGQYTTYLIRLTWLWIAPCNGYCIKNESFGSSHYLHFLTSTICHK